MKKLLLTASALALAAAMSAAVASSVQTASAKSPYCALAKGQKSLVSWNGYYHCVGPAPQAERTSMSARPTFEHRRRAAGYRGLYAEVQPQPTKSPYCALAKGQKSLVSWNGYYHCVGPAPAAARASVHARPTVEHGRRTSRPLYAEVQAQPAKSPYCALAKGQKSLVSWNGYYGCLNR